MAVPSLASRGNAAEVPSANSEAAWSRHLLTWQRGVIRSMVKGQPLADTLAILCMFGEEHLPGRLFSVLLYDPAGRRLLHGAGPSLPQAYNDAIHGIAIGPDVGSCGTAAHEMRQVVVEDIANDPKWAPFLPLTREHGLGACWSTPILATDGRLLGTWAVYLRTPGAPTARDHQVIEAATELAALAIERDEGERALRASQAESSAQQARLANLFEQFPGPVAMLQGPELRIALVNPPYVATVGGRDLVGKTVREAFPELAGTDVNNILEEAFRTGATRRLQEYPAPLADAQGHVRTAWFNSVVQPVRGPDGAIEALITAGYEVTEQVQARKQVEGLLHALQASEDRLRLAVDATHLATWDYDPQTGTVLWDERAYGLFAWPPGAPVSFGQFRDAIHAADREDALAAIERSLDPAGSGKYAAEFRIVTRDGATRWVEAKGQTVFAAGKAVRLIGTALDVTARKEAERELREANERLRSLGRMKTEFLNMASHELRTPLTPLLLRLQMLARHATKLEEKPRRDLTVVLRNAERLSDLITDVLEVARLESGRFPLRAEPFDLEQALGELVQTFEPVAKEKDVRVLNRVEGSLAMVGDAHRIGQVLTNLLDNAIKYTGEGGVVTLHAVGDGNEVTLEVADTGRGMTLEQQERLFEPFSRVHDDPQDGPPGSGLGLFIARTIVEQHRGTITVRSDGPGKGTTFTLRLPRAAPPSSTVVGVPP